MANNLFISYDLNKEPTSKDYAPLIDAIRKLGRTVNVQRSVWYVASTLGSREAFKHLQNFIDNNDSLIVINASENEANWYNVPGGQEITNLWP